MVKIILKWTILVILNSIVAFVFALVIEFDDFPSMAAMLLGIVTFIAIYSKIDMYLLQNKQYELSRSLYLAAILKIFTQFFPAIELLTGVFSTDFVDFIIGRVIFVSVYLITLIEGLLLSFVVFLLMLVVKLVFKKMKSRSVNKKPNLTDAKNVPSS